MCFPGGSVSKETACNVRDCLQENWVPSLGQEDPLEEEMATHSSILAWEKATVHGVTEVRHDLATKSPPPPT